MIRSKIRTERHELLLTPEEKKNWMNKAQTIGLNLNEYIRICVDKRKLSSPLPAVNRVVAVELGRIGTNLNQQIRAMNTALASGQGINNVDETMQRVEEVYQMVRRIQLDLLNNRKPRVTKPKGQASQSSSRKKSRK